MKNLGKKLVEKYCKHQGYGSYSVNEEKLIKAINDALEKAQQDGKKEGIIEAQIKFLHDSTIQYKF